MFKPKARAGLAQKLGAVPKEIQQKFAYRTKNARQISTAAKKCVWIHAVSVGEFNAVNNLLALFHERHPQIEVVVSTSTATGQRQAEKSLGNWASIVYFPFDVPWALSAWLDAVAPQLFVISETEIWPGLTAECQHRQIPIVVVNGRISPRSFGYYLALKALFSPVLQSFAAIGAQSAEEAERYRAIADNQTKPAISVLGNLKFDRLKPHDEQMKKALQRELGLDDSTLVLVAGSTHEGEEITLLQAYKNLRTDFPDLRLIMAPRHPERFDRVAKLIDAEGFTLQKFSDGGVLNGAQQVFLLDTIGRLTDFYSVASIAFIGGTLVPIGGHNLVEPFLYKVPVICGPHLHKTKDSANQLLHRGALQIVKTRLDLEKRLSNWLSRAQARKAAGETGYNWLVANGGATERALALIESVLFTQDIDKNAQLATKQESTLNEVRR